MGYQYHSSWTTADTFHVDDMNPPLSSLDAAICYEKNTLMQGGGVITVASSAATDIKLSWSSKIEFIVTDPDDGQMLLNSMAAGNITIPIGNIAYVALSTVENATVSVTYTSYSTASTAHIPMNRFILGAVGTAAQFVPKNLSVPLSNILNESGTFVHQHTINGATYHSSTAVEGNILIASSNGLPVDADRQLAQYAGARESSLTCAATFTVDFSTAETRFVVLTTNASAIVTGGVNGHEYTLRVQQDATGNWTLALGATANTIKWVGGAAPTITTAATVSDVISLLRSNGTWFGSYTQAHA